MQLVQAAQQGLSLGRAMPLIIQRLAEPALAIVEQYFPLKTAVESEPQAFSFNTLDAVFEASGYFKPTDSSSKSFVPTETGFNLLPEELKPIVKLYLTPENVQTLQEEIQARRMGVLEEAGDLLYEFVVWIALNQGYFEELLPKTREFIETHVQNQDSSKGRSIEEAMENVPMLSPTGRERLMHLTGFTGLQIESLLNITTLKFLCLQSRGRFQNPLADQEKQFWSEFEELNEHVPSGPLKVRLAQATQFCMDKSEEDNYLDAMTHLRGILVDILRATIGPHASLDTLIEYMAGKQLLRQSFNLYAYHMPGMDYNERKRVLKPFEALMELDLVKKAQQTNGFQALG